VVVVTFHILTGRVIEISGMINHPDERTRVLGSKEENRLVIIFILGGFFLFGEEVL
jgi:hypothetical protein